MNMKLDWRDKYRAMTSKLKLAELVAGDQTESVSATINIIVNGAEQRHIYCAECGECTTCRNCECNEPEEKETFDDQWEQMTVDERAKWRDDIGPGR